MEPGSWVILISLIAAILKLGIALFIYQKNPYAKVNRIFAGVFAFQGLWDFGKFMLWISTSESAALIFAKFSYSAYIFSVVMFPHFCWIFLKRRNIFTRSRIGMFIWYIPLYFMLASLWFTDNVIAHLVSPDQSNFGYGIFLWDYAYGPAYNYFFLVYQILPFVYGFYLFIRKYLITKREDLKAQLKLLIIGLAFPLLIGIPTGVILPAMGFRFPPHNNILTLLMSIFIGYALVKYKFLAIRPAFETIDSSIKFDEAMLKRLGIRFSQAYLIRSRDSLKEGYSFLLKQLSLKRYGLIASANNPDEIRKQYKLKNTPIIWITNTETEHVSVGPNDIEQLYTTIATFTQKVQHSVILLDGLDFLISHNNFMKILSLIRRIKEDVIKNKCCLVIPLGGLHLDKKKEKLLSNELILVPQPAWKLGLERTNGKREAKKERFIVLGYNFVSKSLFDEFEIRGIKATIIEPSKNISHLPKHIVTHIKGDPLNTRLLRRLDLKKDNTTVLVTLDDDANVILAINIVRRMSDTVRIIASINNKDFLRIALEAGANEVIPTSTIGGRLMGLALKYPSAIDWIMHATTFTTKGIELVEYDVMPKSRLVGKTVISVDTELADEANILAIKHKEGFSQIPHDHYVLQEGDKIIMVANLDKFHFKEKIYENIRVMIDKRLQELR